MKSGRASFVRLRRGSASSHTTPSLRTFDSSPATTRACLSSAWGARWPTPLSFRGFATIDDAVLDGRAHGGRRQVDKSKQHAQRQGHKRPAAQREVPEEPDFWATYIEQKAVNTARNEEGSEEPAPRDVSLIELSPWQSKPPIKDQLSSPHLRAVLAAVQTRDAHAATRAFIRWTSDLAVVLQHRAAVLAHTNNLEDDVDYEGSAILREAQALPQSTLSEIIHMMDPVANPSLDVAHGLRFSSGNIHHIDLNDVMSVFGIRCYHEAMNEAMLTILAVRVGSERLAIPGRGLLLPSDIEVMMRCAGVSGAHKHASYYWKIMNEPTLYPYRQTSSSIWGEFIKARFSTEPAYYHFDRAKTMVHPRHMNYGEDSLPLSILEFLDHDRFSDNTFRDEPWHRSKYDVTDMFTKRQRQRHGHGAFASHFRRQLLWPDKMTEDLLATAVIGFARAGQIDVVRDGLMLHFLDVQIYTNEDDRVEGIRGGRDFSEEDELRPSPKLLHAITSGLGSAGHLDLAIRLIDFLSARYAIPIPHETWSELLQWLYMHGAKRSQLIAEHVKGHPDKKRRDEVLKKLSDVDVRNLRDMAYEVFSLMTGSNYNIEPALADWDVIIKLKLSEQTVESTESALQILREKVIPRYDTLVEEYRDALADEVLWRSATSQVQQELGVEWQSSSAYEETGARLPTNHPDPSPERLRLRLQLDHLYNTISGHISRVLKYTYPNDTLSDLQEFERATLPSVVLEFSRFLPSKIPITLRHGTLVLSRAHSDRPWWKVQDPQHVEREILPVKDSSHKAGWTRGAGVRWTEAKGSAVTEYKPHPAPRSRTVGRKMPRGDNQKKWQDSPAFRDSARDAWKRELEMELYYAS